MSVRELVSVVISSFREDIATCQKKANLLVEQRVFLGAVDTKNLDQVNAQLSGLADKLKNSSAQREKAMKEFGLSNDRAGFMMLASKLPKAISADMTDLFERLEMHMNRCHSLNERNGELLAEQHTTIRNLLGKPVNSYGETG